MSLKHITTCWHRRDFSFIAIEAPFRITCNMHTAFVGSTESVIDTKQEKAIFYQNYFHQSYESLQFQCVCKDIMLSVYSMHLYVQGHGYNLYIDCFFLLKIRSYHKMESRRRPIRAARNFKINWLLMKNVQVHELTPIQRAQVRRAGRAKSNNSLRWWKTCMLLILQHSKLWRFRLVGSTCTTWSN